MKKRRIVLAATMLTVSMLMFGCGSGKIGESVASGSNAESNPLLDANFKNHYNEVTVGNTTVSFPCDFHELEELGFSCESGSDALIGKETPSTVVLTKDESSVKVRVANNKATDVTVSDSKVVALLATREESEKLALSFYGGITFESSEEDVKKVLDLMESENGEALYGIKMGDYSYLSVSFHNGKVNDIMIVNGENYF